MITFALHNTIILIITRNLQPINQLINTGTNADSQAVIEAVRKQPTGWGGMYDNLLRSIPPLLLATDTDSKGHAEEL